ncbi:MAG: PIG-L deacetylase family protein [Janthinobacterium lividum]
MRAGDYLAALRVLPLGELDDLIGLDPFLVLSPHPDDETLGCGGLLAGAQRQGAVGHVLILTDGAGSHPHSPSFPPERLTALRKDEARRALAQLGLPRERLGFLDLPDTATPSAGPAFDAAVEAIVRRASDVGAKTLFVTWGRDPHCDHETAYSMAKIAAARAGLRLWAYPVWGLHLAADQEIVDSPPQGFRLDIAEDRAAKLRAIDCYESQMTRMIDDDPDAFCFTEAQLAPFLGDTEIYIGVSA